MILILSLIILTNFNHGYHCHSQEFLEQQIFNDPNILDVHKEIESNIDSFNINTDYPVISIGIIFHILYNSDIDNISLEKLNQQINILNDDYNNKNTDLGEDGYGHKVKIFHNNIGNFKLNFYIYDVIRKKSPSRVHVYYYDDDSIKYDKYGGSNVIDSKTKLNVWIGHLQDNIYGYTQYPGGNWDTDGIVLNTIAVGNRELVHQIGHWLNLKHIYGIDDGTCFSSDNINDTPTQQLPTDGCPTELITSCGSIDMSINYMDNTDNQCRTMFTRDQVQRGRSLFMKNGWRYDIALASVYKSEQRINKKSKILIIIISSVIVGISCILLLSVLYKKKIYRQPSLIYMSKTSKIKQQSYLKAIQNALDITMDSIHNENESNSYNDTESSSYNSKSTTDLIQKSDNDKAEVT